MPRPRKLTSKERKAKLIKGFEMAELSKRQCKRCRERSLSCSVNEHADRCLECVRSCADCSLAPLNYSRLKRLQDKNEQLKRERDEALAKSYKASVEIQSIESQLGEMVKQELENIAVQEEEERAEASHKTPSEPPPNGVGELDFSEWDSLTAGFDFGTAPTSQGS